jgi:hypothetical protein
MVSLGVQIAESHGGSLEGYAREPAAVHCVCNTRETDETDDVVV